MKRIIAIAATAICCMGNDMPAQANDFSWVQDIVPNAIQEILTERGHNVQAVNCQGKSCTATVSAIDLEDSDYVKQRLAGPSLKQKCTSPSYREIYTNACALYGYWPSSAK